MQGAYCRHSSKFFGAQANPNKQQGRLRKLLGIPAAVTKLEILTDLIESRSCPLQARQYSTRPPSPGLPASTAASEPPIAPHELSIGHFTISPDTDSLTAQSSPAAGARQRCGDSPGLESQFPKGIVRRCGVMADEIDQYEGRQPYIHV